jgi:release factor glutamine methyltransferase
MDVYMPQEDSMFLADFVAKFAKGRVLDVGTGSGIQAVTALKNSAVTEVVAIDANPAAVDFVQNTIESDNLENITVRESRFFANVEGMFDTIISNPPYLPDDDGVEDISLYGGKVGFEWIEEFLSQVPSFLSLNGRILLLFSTLTNKDRVDQVIRENGFLTKELGQLALFFERLYVYELWLK